MIELTTCYSKYKEEFGDHDEAIDIFLSAADRKGLISPLQKHCADCISSEVNTALATGRRMDSSGLDVVSSMTPDIGAANEPVSQKEMYGLQRTELPYVVLACVNQHVRPIVSLRVQGLGQTIAATLKESLAAF